jgi:hypothetical protein
LIFEVTTPVPLDGSELLIGARAVYRDAGGRPREGTAHVALRVCDAEEALRAPVDDEVIARLLVQLPARTEMDAALAYEAGDPASASAAIARSHQAMAAVRRWYGPAATARTEMSTWQLKLSDLAAAAEAGPPSSGALKTMFAAGYGLSRSRRTPPM